MPLKVLQLCHKPPFPSIDGGCLEMAKTSTFFDNSPHYELEILTLHTKKHPFVKTAFSKKLNTKNYQSVFVDTKLTPWRALIGLIKRKSYNLSRFSSLRFKEELIKSIKNTSFDIIQLESIFVGEYLTDIKKHSKAKIVLNSPNIEYKIWKRLAKRTKNPLKKIYLAILAKQLEREEKKIYTKVDAIIAITQKDEFIYKEVVPNTKTITIPFAINLNDYNVNKKPHTNISFFHLGSMNWSPNVEGVSWFINQVWKTHFSSQENINFNIAGIDMPKEFFELSIKNLTVQGFVEDAKEFIYKHNVMIVPLFSGSGLRVKIIEAMAMGKCVVSTSIGAEGINYQEGLNILIANTAQEFKEQINKLSLNPKRSKEIGNEARKLIEKSFNKKTLNKTMDDFYNSLV